MLTVRLGGDAGGIGPGGGLAAVAFGFGGGGGGLELRSTEVGLLLLGRETGSVSRGLAYNGGSFEK
jgi:hypothetical protein